MAKVAKSSKAIQALFWTVFATKSFLVARGVPFQTLFDTAVFGQVGATMGGKLRVMVNGASAISAGMQHFMSMFIAPMLSGYGLTETCADGAMGSPFQYMNPAIGPFPRSTEAKLVSVPELDYSADRIPPQGEIWVRGSPTIVEYWKNSEETAKAITSDGWFRTGDVDEFDENGRLKVIDRVKNLVKLQGGQYIALEKLESIYRSSHIVNHIMIFGSGEHPRPVAVITTNEEPLADLAKKLGEGQRTTCFTKIR